MSELIPKELMTFPGMRNLLREFFDDPLVRGNAGAFNDEGNLALDVSESKDGEVVVRASLPGFRKEDVHLTVRNGVLNIKAESKEEREINEEKFYRKERRWGSLSRSVALPGKLDENSVKADLKDGVLTVKLRQSPEAQPRRIEVK